MLQPRGFELEILEDNKSLSSRIQITISALNMELYYYLVMIDKHKIHKH